MTQAIEPVDALPDAPPPPQKPLRRLEVDILNPDERWKIASSLEDYHRIFYVFLDELESIGFVDDPRIPTAGVIFSKWGRPRMLLNREFWANLNHRERLFVICHECLHVLLDHGMRNGKHVAGSTHRLVNYAQDITINEMICRLFSYDRNDFRGWEKACWIDTCFKEPKLVKPNETFYYYLDLLIKQREEHQKNGGSGDGMKGGGEFDLVDAHDLDPDDLISGEARDELAEAIAEALGQEELEKLIKALKDGPHGDEAGTMEGHLDLLIAKQVKLRKLNFTRMVAKLKRSRFKEKLRDVESFVHDGRRFSDLISTPNIVIPGVHEQGRPIKDRLLTAVFMDISGSCIDHAPVFQEVFLAFDREKDIFETRLFTFDTRVKEVRPGTRINAGGGTAFCIIESRCQQLKAELGRYPDCVVVITDGYGDNVAPERPERWVWLLTPNSSKELIPTKSRSWAIEDVTFGTPV